MGHFVYDTMRHFIIFFENRVYDRKVYGTKCTTSISVGAYINKHLRTETTHHASAF